MRIDRLQMMTLLVEACPTFEAEWRTFLSDWADEPDLPCFIALSSFARHLSLVMARGDDWVLKKVFSALEQLVTNGDDYVQNAAVCGLIEDLQNANLHTGTSPSDYIPYLLPESLLWWERTEKFWTGRDSASS